MTSLKRSAVPALLLQRQIVRAEFPGVALKAPLQPLQPGSGGIYVFLRFGAIICYSGVPQFDLIKRCLSFQYLPSLLREEV